MQHEITEKKPLLHTDGTLTEPGFAKKLLWDYERSAVRAGSLRIKEWDYYLVTDGHVGVALTIADNSYMGLSSISLLQFDEKWEQTVSPMKLLPMGKTHLPPTSAVGDVSAQGKGYSLSFFNDGTQRRLIFHMDHFYKGAPIDGEITLENHGGESMVIATPFPKKKKHFYYNQKINCLPAWGSVTMGDRVFTFSPDSAVGTLDWGRGVWTYKNTWYWGSASGYLDGIPFGFNIGYGFGDTSAASENMVFFNHKAHKLSAVTFHIPTKDGKEDYLSPWKFSSDDERFQMDFIPVLDRAAKTDTGLLCSDQHQVFGHFTGRVILDDGTVLFLQDFFGFAEKVRNKW